MTRHNMQEEKKKKKEGEGAYPKNLQVVFYHNKE